MTATSFTLNRMLAGLLAFVLLAGISANSEVEAAAPKQLGNYKKWTAYTMTDQTGRVCYMFSNPTDMLPKGVNRGEVFFLVTHRPGADVVNEISIQTGYTFRKDSTVDAAIGSTKYDMFTELDGAWLRTAEEERKMIESMKKGSTMKVSGFSNRGTNTKDTYSLSGFTAAYNAISRACKVK